MKKYLFSILLCIIYALSGYSLEIINNQATTGSRTFNEEVWIIGSYTILNGHTVTINANVKCFPNTQIRVNAGATLIVENATITTYSSNEMWRGIFIAGNDVETDPQYHGKLELKNAIIENAEIAISCGAPYYFSSGIVRAENTTFINNNQSLMMYRYTRIDNNSEINNHSYFLKCNFIVDDNNNFNSEYFSKHVSLSNSNGIIFRGCFFENNISAIDISYLIVSGITSINSSFVVDQYCPGTITSCGICEDTQNSVRSTFSKFFNGIGIFGWGNDIIEIDNTDFIHNLNGIHASSVNDHISITRCNFTFTDDVIQKSGFYGVSLYNVNNYTLEENTFENQTEFLSNGIEIQNSGITDNIIYRNNFLTGNGTGISVSGNNGDMYPPGTGLRIECNNFYNTSGINSYNSLINTPTSINPIQGSPLQGAENSFASGYISFFSYGTQERQNILYYHNNSPEFMPVLSSSNLYPLPFAQKNSCLSTICYTPLPITTSSSSQFNEIGYQIDELNKYNKLKDSYYHKLEDFYASNFDKIILEKNTENESTFEQAILKQIELSILNRQMSETSKKNIKTLLKNERTNSFKLQKWYESIHVPETKYALVESYWDTGNYEDAEKTLKEIPLIFELSESAFNEHENYVKFFNFKNDIFSLKKNFSDLTENEMKQLKAFAEGRDRASAIAQGILCFYYDICNRNREIQNLDLLDLQKHKQNIVNKNVTIFPNPTKEDLNINCDDSQIKSVKIMDITGKTITKILNINSRETNINIKDLTSGVYFIEITTENKIISNKIIKN